MLEIKTPVPVTKYVTSDARVHDNVEDARVHEMFLALSAVGGVREGTPYAIVTHILRKFDLVERK